jgi:hypothetical protein
VGDRLQFSGRVQTTGLLAAGSYWTMSLQMGASQLPGDIIGMYTSFSDSDGTWLAEGVVPAGTTTIKVNLQSGSAAGGSYTVKFGEVTIRNLTALGIA